MILLLFFFLKGFGYWVYLVRIGFNLLNFVMKNWVFELNCVGEKGMDVRILVLLDDVVECFNGLILLFLIIIKFFYDFVLI